MMQHIGSTMNLMAASNITGRIQSKIVDKNLTQSENHNIESDVIDVISDTDTINYGVVNSSELYTSTVIPKIAKLLNVKNNQNSEDTNRAEIILDDDEEVIEPSVSIDISDGKDENEFDEKVMNKFNGSKSPDKEITIENNDISYAVVTGFVINVTDLLTREEMVTEVPNDIEISNLELPARSQKLRNLGSMYISEQENTEIKKGGALTEFFHSYSMSKDDYEDMNISGDDKPVELMPLDDFLSITEHLVLGRKTNNSELAMDKANVATGETVFKKLNKDEEVTTEAEILASDSEDASEDIEKNFLSQLQSFNVLNEVIEDLDARIDEISSETPAQDRTDVIDEESLDSKHSTDETTKEKSGDLLSNIFGFFGF